MPLCGESKVFNYNGDHITEEIIVLLPAEASLPSGPPTHYLDLRPSPQIHFRHIKKSDSFFFFFSRLRVQITEQKRQSIFYSHFLFVWSVLRLNGVMVYHQFVITLLVIHFPD